MQSSSNVGAPTTSSASHFKFSLVKGYFAQSEDETDDTTFDFVCFSIHLICRG
jgi:hypothetical protein